jgi:sugar (pentulose or hexulose) kinase
LLKGATHDTAGVVAAIPFETEDRTFLATGSLFACGMELAKPRVTEEAYKARGSNEYGVEGTTRFLKDVTGFNILESARNSWAARDQPHAYDEILSLMYETDPFGPLIDPDAPKFVAGTLQSDDIVTEIREYCEATGQRVPEDVGEVTRCILESLAAKIAYVFEELQIAAEIESQQLHVVGGGARNEPFLQMISGATGLPIVAGPVEAAAVGNLLVQMSATGEIEDIAEGRSLIRRSVKLDEYEPQNRDAWVNAKERVASMVESDGFS